ncbi:hypothetical protein D3C86_1360620 [compost metagenome]
MRDGRQQFWIAREIRIIIVVNAKRIEHAVARPADSLAVRKPDLMIFRRLIHRIKRREKLEIILVVHFRSGNRVAFERGIFAAQSCLDAPFAKFPAIAYITRINPLVI